MVFGKKKAKDKGKVSPSTSTGGALPSFPGAELVAQQQAALATANNNLATGSPVSGGSGDGGPTSTGGRPSQQPGGPSMGPVPALSGAAPGGPGASNYTPAPIVAAVPPQQQTSNTLYPSVPVTGADGQLQQVINNRPVSPLPPNPVYSNGPSTPILNPNNPNYVPVAPVVGAAGGGGATGAGGVVPPAYGVAVAAPAIIPVGVPAQGTAGVAQGVVVQPAGVSATGVSGGVTPVATASTDAPPPGYDAQRKEWEIDHAELEYGDFVAKGGFGAVYRGLFRGTDVAIKQLLDASLTRAALEEFKKEIDIMSKLRHPNINMFMAACLEPKHMCIVTQYEERGSLWSILHDSEQQFDWQKMLKMAIDVAKGMAYLHGSSPPIIHRDLKSPNLLVDENWTVKIADFGLTTAKNATITQCGTSQWMAPEMLNNDEYTFKADVYSFAICLWEMCTRQLPYEGMNPISIGIKVLEGMRPTMPEYVPAPIAEIISVCWAANPDDRPVFTEILKELKAIKEVVQ